MDILLNYILLSPWWWLIFIIFLIILSLSLKSHIRQRDIQKGIEKALKKLNTEDEEEDW